MGTSAGHEQEIVSSVSDLSDVPLTDLVAAANEELAATLQRIAPATPGDEPVPVSAFNSSI
jgi:FXSXX-COOH protein